MHAFPAKEEAECGSKMEKRTNSSMGQRPKRSHLVCCTSLGCVPMVLAAYVCLCHSSLKLHASYILFVALPDTHSFCAM